MMDKDILNLVDDPRVPDELKVKLIMLGLKMRNCVNIKQAKEILQSTIDIFTEIENLPGF